MLIQQTEPDNQEELLLRILKDKVFRFIIIQYNHRNVIFSIKELIRTNCVNRTLETIDGKDISFEKFLTVIQSVDKGIVFLEDFDAILQNEQFYPALNQRRDLIAQSAISLIVFLPSGADYLNDCISKIPDLWSFRSGLFEFNIDIPKESLQNVSSSISDEQPFSSTSRESRIEDYNRLKKRIKELEPVKENLPLLNSIYPQLLELQHGLAYYKEGLETAKEFLTLAEKNNYEIEGTTLLGNIYNYLGIFYKDLGDFNNAKGEFTKAIELEIKNFGEDHPNTSIYRSNLAVVLQDLGELNEAKELISKALQSNIKILGEDHPQSATYRSNLAMILCDLGNLTEAKEITSKVLQSDIKNLGENHPSTSIDRSNLAIILHQLGELNEAKEIISKALLSDIKNFGEDHPKIAIRRSNLAMILLDIGEFNEAKKQAEKAYNFNKNKFGDAHPDTIKLKNNLDSILEVLKQRKKSQE
jgi:tetratricopeptide (TPR) repeat protein